MKCPWKLNVPQEIRTDDECDPDCAWLVEPHGGGYGECAIAIIASSGTEVMGFHPVNGEERDA